MLQRCRNVLEDPAHTHSKSMPNYLWVVEIVHQLLDRQVVREHLKGFWPVLRQRVVHVKADALQQA